MTSTTKKGSTFRKLPSGKWQARVSKDGKERSIGTFRTKKEAEIEAAKVEELIYYGQTLNDRNMLCGHYLTPSIIRETMQDYCKKAGVDYKGTHGFRHTHAFLMLESGVSIKYVSNRLGHKTIKTTADTYLDITEKIEEDELKKFASYTKR